MTPDQLRDTLRALAGHLAEIHDDLETEPLHSARMSQTGVRAGTTGSKMPCNATDLDYLVSDVAPCIRGWCTYLQQSAHVTGLPDGWVPLNVWVAFLARNRETLLAQTWADEAVDELGKLEEELRHRLHPTDPEKIAAIGAIARDRKGPASEIARLLTTLTGKRVDRRKVNYLAKSGRIKEYMGKDDIAEYSLIEAREALEDWHDRRDANTA